MKTKLDPPLHIIKSMAYINASFTLAHLYFSNTHILNHKTMGVPLSRDRHVSTLKKTLNSELSFMAVRSFRGWKKRLFRRVSLKKCCEARRHKCFSVAEKVSAIIQRMLRVNRFLSSSWLRMELHYQGQSTLVNLIWRDLYRTAIE